MNILKLLKINILVVGTELGRGKLLKEIAKEVFGEGIASKVWGRIEVIGDIAVVRKPPDLDLSILRVLAQELLKRLKYVKSVWAAITPIEGTYRVRQYVYLAGEPRSVTLYKEHGCIFKIDITKVYISPALNYEHIRIAKQVQDGEFIINMFAGAGLFSIIIAKHAKPKKVVSIDINPHAYKLMKENIKLNKVEGIVEPVLGDAGEVVLKYKETADRILMPLPELAYKYIPRALYALKKQGIIHVYDFISAEKEEQAIEQAKIKYLTRLKELKAQPQVQHARTVRSVGPKYYQVVLDIKIRKY